MKFSNLQTIQQLAILADLAGVLSPTQHKYHPGPYLRPNEVAEIDTSRYGLSQSVSFFKLVRAFTCNPNPDDTEARCLRFNQYIDTQEVVLFVSMSNNPDYRDELGLGKFGIGNDLVIKNVDVKESLNQTVKFLESFEKLLEIKNDVSSVIKKMFAQIPKAELIDEDFLDNFYINKNISCKLGVLRQGLYNLRKDFDNSPFGEAMTPEQYDNLDYVYDLRGPSGLFIYHYPSRNNPNASILSINFGQNGDDMVEIFCGKRGDSKPHRIAAFIPTNNTDDKGFLKNIRDAIEEAVTKSEYRDVAVNKLTYFLTILDSLNEVIDAGEHISENYGPMGWF